MDRYDVKRLQEIRTKICDLMTEAEDILRCHASKSVLDRAKAYWIGYMHNALGGDFNQYLGGTPSFADTIRAEGGLVDCDCDRCGEDADDCDCEDEEDEEDEEEAAG